MTNPKIKSELDKYLGDSIVSTPLRTESSFQDPDEPVSTTGTMLDAAPMPTDSYVIKSGDTMGKIAANNPFTLTQLIASNPQIEDPNKIEVGQYLNFPPVGEAKAGQLPASMEVVAEQPIGSSVEEDPLLSQDETTRNTAVQKYLGITEDGDWGVGSTRSLAGWQYKYGLPVSGQIDQETIEAMKDLDTQDPRKNIDRINVLNESETRPDISQIKKWAKKNIKDPMKASAFVATVEAESRTGLTEVGYTLPQAISKFVEPYRLKDSSGRPIQGAAGLGPRMTARKNALDALGSNATADEIFNVVYGNTVGVQDLGNTQNGDGARFKGRGLLQITGRDNYTRVGNILGLDLVSNPELVNDPKHAAAAAMAYLSLAGKDYFKEDLTEERLADIIGHHRGSNAARTRWRRAEEIKTEMYNP